MTHHKKLFNQVFHEFGIEAGEPQAYFLAQIDHESAGLRRLTENLNYSVAGLLSTFSRERISEAEARQFGRIKGVQLAYRSMIANRVYGGAWGKRNLGNTHAEDGWNYRGRGAIQCTGRANYTAYTEALKNTPHYFDYVGEPDRMATVADSLRFAGWFWTTRKISNLISNDMDATIKEIAGATRRINGGNIGLYHRKLLTLEYLKPEHEFWAA